MSTFNPNAPAPTYKDDGAHQSEIDAIKPHDLAIYVVENHTMRADVARLFSQWLLKETPDLLHDEESPLTWGDLVARGLEDWRPSTRPETLTITVIDDHHDEGLADRHGDPWDPNELELKLAPEAARALAEYRRPDTARQFVVHEGEPRLLSRSEEGQADADGVLKRIVLEPRYVLR